MRVPNLASEIRCLALPMAVRTLYLNIPTSPSSLSLGAYAEYIVVSTAMLIHKPPELSWEEAAGIPEAS